MDAGLVFVAARTGVLGDVSELRVESHESQSFCLKWGKSHSYAHKHGTKQS